MPDELVAVTADPDYVQIATALIRGLLQIASGFGFTWALTVSGSQITMAATAAVMLATLVWAAWQKVQAARAKHEAAVTSAKTGAPLAPA